MAKFLTLTTIASPKLNTEVNGQIHFPDRHPLILHILRRGFAPCVFGVDTATVALNRRSDRRVKLMPLLQVCLGLNQKPFDMCIAFFYLKSGGITLTIQQNLGTKLSSMSAANLSRVLHIRTALEQDLLESRLYNRNVVLTKLYVLPHLCNHPPHIVTYQPDANSF
jgi:hypothetical protein